MAWTMNSTVCAHFVDDSVDLQCVDRCVLQ